MLDPNRERSREDHVFLAKVADHAERYQGMYFQSDTHHTSSVTPYLHLQEMLNHIKKITAKGEELTIEERNLLSTAYKNLIGSRRTSWRIVSALYRKEEKRGYKEQAEMVQEIRNKIETELENICLDVINVVDKDLLPHTKVSEAKVFYHKMSVIDFPADVLQIR
jgi:14-3-3 protein epsilon